MSSVKHEKIKLKKTKAKGDKFDKTSFSLVSGKKELGVAELKHYPKDKVSELSFLYLDEKYRGMGLSKRFMNEIVKDIDSKGYVGKLDLVTKRSNVPKLEHLYTEYGFKECGEKDCVFTADKDDPFCTVPYLREGLNYDRHSLEYREEKKKWCNKPKRKKR